MLAGGCATSSKDIATNYVSPVHLQSYDCSQLGVLGKQMEDFTEFHELMAQVATVVAELSPQILLSVA